MTGLHPLQAGYAGVFAAAAVACFAGLIRARDIPDGEVRRGLVWLLGLSGVWGSFATVRMLVTDPGLGSVLYICGLVVGLAAVLAWLYFTSAYAGREFHREPGLRRAAVASYLAVVSLKISNPVHGWYFSVRLLGEPFPHLTIQQEPVHWVVLGVAYAGAAAGFYFLYDTFTTSRYRSRRLTLLALLTVLPVAVNVVAFTRPAVPEVNFEVVGVGGFAVGALFFVEKDFLRARLTARRALLDELRAPALVVDSSGRLLDYNDRVADLFGGADLRVQLSEQAPALAAVLDGESSELSLDSRTFLVQQQSAATGGGSATTVVLREVTEYERRGREIERQNEQLQAIADAVAHNLRNASNVLLGHVDRAERSLSADGGTATSVADTRESLTIARRTADRIAATAEDLRLLAAYGQTVTATSPTAAGSVAREAWTDVESGAAALRCEDAPTVEADPTRLRFLLRAAFRFHLANGAEAVTIEALDGPTAPAEYEPEWGPATTGGTGDPAGFVVAGDGVDVVDEREASLLAFDSESGTDTAGLGLPVARALAEAHGWRLGLDIEDGIRLHVYLTPD